MEFYFICLSNNFIRNQSILRNKDAGFPKRSSIGPLKLYKTSKPKLINNLVNIKMKQDQERPKQPKWKMFLTDSKETLHDQLQSGTIL